MTDKILRLIRAHGGRPQRNKSAPSEMPNGGAQGPSSRGGGEQYHEAVLQSYKDLIRSQDEQMAALKKQLLDTQHRLALAERNIQEMHLVIPTQGGGPAPGSQAAEMTEGLVAQIGELQRALQQRNEELSRMSALLFTQQQQIMAYQAGEAELRSLSQAYNELEDHLRRKDAEIEQLRTRMGDPSSSTPAAQAGAEVQGLREALARANTEIAQSKAAAEISERERLQLLMQIRELQQLQAAGNTAGAPTAENASARVVALEAELRETQARYQSMEEEQEELLIALAKTEIENNNLKERLLQIDPSFVPAKLEAEHDGKQ
jgi:DNA repair exonuclease SbcCD ATPase subunit